MWQQTTAFNLLNKIICGMHAVLFRGFDVMLLSVWYLKEPDNK